MSTEPNFSHYSVLLDDLYGEDVEIDDDDLPDLDTDGETCSWCTTEVPDAELTMIADGARLCDDCVGIHMNEVEQSKLHCYKCDDDFHVLHSGISNRQDPTAWYRLECGHTVL
jgi:hypothetical protein